MAQKLCAASTSIEAKLRGLDDQLDVGQSAGTYSTGGPKWATSFDQSASDVFEVGSTTSIAARELGYQVHQAGLNWAHAENESQGGTDQPVPLCRKVHRWGQTCIPKATPSAAHMRSRIIGI